MFVPFFGGKKEQLRRHLEFIAELGYVSAVIENHPPRSPVHPKRMIARDGRWGIKHVWADDIEEFLHELRGPKIIFAFSGPSSCAIEALARSPGNLLEVKGLICDSGPFLYDRYCNRNRLYIERGIKNPVLLAAVASIHKMIWSRNHEQTLRDTLSRLPQHFPVLSIRPLSDVLVPPWTVDAAFRDQKHLSLEILDVPGAGHLKGLRDHPEIYKPAVQRFIEKISRPLEPRVDATL